MAKPTLGMLWRGSGPSQIDALAPFFTRGGAKGEGVLVGYLQGDWSVPSIHAKGTACGSVYCDGRALIHQSID